FRAGRDVGAGPGTRAAAGRLLGGAHWSTVGAPAPYAGNGSAMRAGPIGVLFAADHHMLVRVAREQSRITHLDPRCAAGAVAVAHAVALAREPGAVDPSAFLARLGESVEREDGSVAAAVRGLADWLLMPPVAAARHLQACGLEPASRGQWQGISAFVTSSVVWSLYAFLRSPDDYWESVCTAIGVGGDTDTMAAMTGAMAGARLGPEALPAPLLERLTDRGHWGAVALEGLARACARIA
ncbi:MAG: ADP-ribosylglycohydrolase family protein, partial [Gemmatimonadales bacterium]